MITRRVKRGEHKKKRYEGTGSSDRARHKAGDTTGSIYRAYTGHDTTTIVLILRTSVPAGAADRAAVAGAVYFRQ